jgi:DNA-binding CsgD family transcriptional regulator
MSNIPQARRLLLAAKMKLDEAYALMVRAQPDKRVPRESRPLTKPVIREIWKLRSAGMSMRKIAEALNINQGRVSEVVNGKKTGATQ